MTNALPNARADQRRHPRICVCVPIACTSVDAEARPLDMNMGVIRDVSQAGLLLEANRPPESERLLLTYVDLERNIVELYGWVVRTQPTPAGTCRVGMRLDGSPEAKLEFVRKLVRLHHYTKKAGAGTADGM